MSQEQLPAIPENLVAEIKDVNTSDVIDATIIPASVGQNLSKSDYDHETISEIWDQYANASFSKGKEPAIKEDIQNPFANASSVQVLAALALLPFMAGKQALSNVVDRIRALSGKKELSSVRDLSSLVKKGKPIPDTLVDKASKDVEGVFASIGASYAQKLHERMKRGSANWAMSETAKDMNRELEKRIGKLEKSGVLDALNRNAGQFENFADKIKQSAIAGFFVEAERNGSLSQLPEEVRQKIAMAMAEIMNTFKSIFSSMKNMIFGGGAPDAAANAAAEMASGPSNGPL
ncbi:MAG: hypothetical protein D6732_17285 [Methanobacteriota archaeon]|nr:MAG: hypothetical protein D6732_17285 [Euryarchaeota archaeon]